MLKKVVKVLVYQGLSLLLCQLATIAWARRLHCLMILLVINFLLLDNFPSLSFEWYFLGCTNVSHETSEQRVSIKRFLYCCSRSWLTLFYLLVFAWCRVEHITKPIASIFLLLLLSYCGICAVLPIIEIFEVVFHTISFLVVMVFWSILLCHDSIRHG